MITAEEALKMTRQNITMTDPLGICEEQIMEAAKEGKIKTKVVFDSELNGEDANNLMVALENLGYQTYPFPRRNWIPMDLKAIHIYWGGGEWYL